MKPTNMIQKLEYIYNIKKLEKRAYYFVSPLPTFKIS